MPLSAVEWLNVPDWQGELINWFLLSNCSRTLTAFELTVITRGEKKGKPKTALLDNSMKTSVQFAAVVRRVNKRRALPLLKIY